MAHVIYHYRRLIYLGLILLFKKMKNIYITLLSFVMFAVTSCEDYTDVTPKGALVIETPEQFLELVSLPGRGYPITNFQYL